LHSYGIKGAACGTSAEHVHRGAGTDGSFDGLCPRAVCSGTDTSGRMLNSAPNLVASGADPVRATQGDVSMLALPARGFLGLVKLATIVTDFAIYYLARLLDYMLVDPLKVVFGWTTKKALPASGETSDTTVVASIGAFRRLMNKGLEVLDAIAPRILSVRVEQIFRWTEAGFAALGSAYLKNKQYLHDIAVGDSASARLLCVAMGYFDAFCTVSFVSALGEPVLGRFGKAVAEASASHGTVIKVSRSPCAVHAVVLTVSSSTAWILHAYRTCSVPYVNGLHRRPMRTTPLPYWDLPPKAPRPAGTPLAKLFCSLVMRNPVHVS
jgi:hypothetical protein